MLTNAADSMEQLKNSAREAKYVTQGEDKSKVDKSRSVFAVDPIQCRIDALEEQFKAMNGKANDSTQRQ